MIEVRDGHQRRKRERTSVQVRLAPQDAQALAQLCADSGRSYGEQVALWLREYHLRAKQSA